MFFYVMRESGPMMEPWGTSCFNTHWHKQVRWKLNQKHSYLYLFDEVWLPKGAYTWKYFSAILVIFFIRFYYLLRIFPGSGNNLSFCTCFAYNKIEHNNHLNLTKSHITAPYHVKRVLFVNKVISLPNI